MRPSRKRSKVFRKVFEARILAPPASTFSVKSISDVLQSNPHHGPLPFANRQPTGTSCRKAVAFRVTVSKGIRSTNPPLQAWHQTHWRKKPCLNQQTNTR